MLRKRRAATIGVLQFTRMIPDEDAAVAHFEAIRWGASPHLPALPRG